MPDPHVGKSTVSPITFTTVQEHLWCSSPVCGSPARWHYSGIMVTSFERTYATFPRFAAARAPVTEAGQCWPMPPKETTLTGRSGSVSSRGPCSFSPTHTAPWGSGCSCWLLYPETENWGGENRCSALSGAFLATDARPGLLIRSGKGHLCAHKPPPSVYSAACFSGEGRGACFYQLLDRSLHQIADSSFQSPGLLHLLNWNTVVFAAC